MTLLAVTPPEQRGKALAKISQRFGSSLQMTDRQLQDNMEKSVEDLAEVASILHVNLKQSPFARQTAAFVGGATTVDAALTPHAHGVGATNDSLAQTLLGDAPLPGEDRR